MTTSATAIFVQVCVRSAHISESFSDIIAEIHACGGLAIWAHPMKGTRCVPNLQKIQELDGIEIWNLKADRWAGPKLDTLRLFRQVNSRPAVFSTVGLDLHKRLCDPWLSISIQARCLTEPALFSRFRAVICQHKERPLYPARRLGRTELLACRGRLVQEIRRIQWASRLYRSISAACFRGSRS